VGGIVELADEPLVFLKMKYLEQVNNIISPRRYFSLI
jgi:hypothetical protein